MGGSVTGQLETERKYETGPGFTMPDFRAVTGCASVTDPEVQQLSATYFDTPGMGLAAHRVTLRRRTGGSDEGWHLKLPVRPGTRQEVHAPLGEGTGRVPPRLAEQVAGITGGEPLVPVAVLDTHRTVRRLTGPSGDVLAEVADDQVTGRRLAPPDGGARTAPPDGGDQTASPLRWREIEVEIVSGPPSLLDAAGKLLAEAGARPSQSPSKVGRVLSSG